MTPAPPDLAPLWCRIGALEAITRTPALVLCASVEERTVPVVHGWLTRARPPALDVVLCTAEGFFAPARKLSHLLRRACGRVRLLVPVASGAAGTLLAAAADEIVFGDLGELGPLDPELSWSEPGSGQAVRLAAEDVRQFAAMARDWFGVEAAREGIQLVDLLSRHVFPPVLTSALRHQRAVVEAAAELLDRHLAGAPEGERERVARALVAGAGQCGAGLLPHDVARLGLRARLAGGRERTALAAVGEEAGRLLEPPGGGRDGALGAVAARDWAAWAARARQGEHPAVRWHSAEP